MYPILSSRRSNTVDIFEKLRTRATLASLFAKIFTKNNSSLASFAEKVPQATGTRSYRGVQDLPIKDIIGSVGREKDFDSNFRPLKKHLRDRWVNIYLLSETEPFPPILVYKFGNDYYVEDGHHRVSVARTLEMFSIRAEVWEYPPNTVPCQTCPLTLPRRRQQATIPVCSCS